MKKTLMVVSLFIVSCFSYCFASSKENGEIAYDDSSGEVAGSVVGDAPNGSGDAFAVRFTPVLTPPFYVTGIKLYVKVDDCPAAGKNFDYIGLFSGTAKPVIDTPYFKVISPAIPVINTSVPGNSRTIFSSSPPNSEVPNAAKHTYISVKDASWQSCKPGCVSFVRIISVADCSGICYRCPGSGGGAYRR